MATSGSSISGLASGLDTASLIDQFMTLEAASQTRLKKQVTSEQTAVSSLQTLNAKLVALGTKAETTAKPATWNALSATSSLASVSVTAAAGAAAGSLDVRVVTTARSTQLGYATAAAKTDVVTGASTSVRLTKADGSTLDVDSGDGTLSGLASAINAGSSTSGLRATLVKASETTYRLLVESTTTGASTAGIGVTQLDGSALLGGATVRAGRDAELDLGAGLTARSSTNTFTDLLPGVTVTLGTGTADGATTSLVVARDAAAVKASVQGLVDAVNNALGDLDSLTAYNATTKASGVLAGDATARSLRAQLLDTVRTADGSSLASVGIQLDKYGKLTFDGDKFAAAYAADPAGTAAKFTATGAAGSGFATRVDKVADLASNSTTGVVTAAITGRNDRIKRLNDAVQDWDVRLQLRRNALTRQFTALETALSQMNNQSNWLSGQIKSLDANKAS